MTEAKRGRQRIAGVSRTVFLLGLVSLFNDTASEMIYPLLPVFLTSIGASVSLIGVIEGIAETTASLLKLFSGWIADRLQRKRLLTAAGYTASNLVRPLIGLATSGWQVLGLRFADRLGKGVRTSPRDAMIADTTAPDDRGHAYGFNRAMDHAGAMLGSLVTFLLMTLMGLPVRTIFLLSVIPGILAVAFVLVGVGTARDPVTAPVSPPRLSLSPFGARFKWFLVIVAVFALGNSSDAFLLLRANEVGVPVQMLPLLWILFHTVKSLSSIPGGMMSDRVGRPRVLLAGWVVYALVYLGFSAAATQTHIWLLFAGYGLFFGLTEGVEKAFVADMAPEKLRATAFGVYHFTLGTMALPASILCGYLWQNISSTVALRTGALLAGIASVMLSASGRRSSEPPKQRK